MRAAFLFLGSILACGQCRQCLDGLAAVAQRTGGVGAERISVAAPSKQAQQAALEMAAKRARVVYLAGLRTGTGLKMVAAP